MILPSVFLNSTSCSYTVNAKMEQSVVVVPDSSYLNVNLVVPSLTSIFLFCEIEINKRKYASKTFPIMQEDFHQNTHCCCAQISRHLDRLLIVGSDDAGL